MDFEKPISINFLKMQPYFGSYNGVSFALIKKEIKIEDKDKEEKLTKLEAYLYPLPFGFDATPEERKLKAEFDFSDEGYDQAVAWMNEHFADFEFVPHGKRFAFGTINKS